MNTTRAFMIWEANREKELKVFDWIKAATLIKERKVQVARAGLSEDWERTGGCIFRDGKPLDKENTYVYLAATWATPELELDGEIIECYIMQSQSPDGKWSSDTLWPKEALDILNS